MERARGKAQGTWDNEGAGGGPLRGGAQPPGALPMHPYDPAEKVTRKVYRDCQVTFAGNRYVVPHALVSRVVLLKIRHGTLRLYDRAEKIDPGAFMKADFDLARFKSSPINQPEE